MLVQLVQDLENSKKSKYAKNEVQGRVRVKVAFDAQPWQVSPLMNDELIFHKKIDFEEDEQTSSRSYHDPS